MTADKTGRTGYQDVFSRESFRHNEIVTELEKQFPDRDRFSRYHEEVKNNRWLWLVLLIALFFRWPLLNGSFWLDEAAQALESVRPFFDQWQIVPDFQPPLLHYLVHFVARASTDEAWLRLWGALIPGLVTIWVTYKLGKQLFSERAGLLAALLLATSSFHVFYSQELRPYSLSAMWGMLTTWLLLSPNFQWWKFALLSLAGLYSSYLYPFLLLPQLWLLWRQERGKERVMKTVATIGVLYLPWLPMFFQQLNAGQALRLNLPGWENVVSLPQFKALALVPLKFIFGVTDLAPTPFFIIALMLLGLSLVFIWREKLQLTQSVKNLLILLLAPLLLSWLVSFAVPVIQPKRLIFLLPIAYLLTAWPLAKKVKLKSWLWLLPTLLLFLNLWSSWQYWTQPSLQRENWRALKQQIIADFPAERTLAVFAFDEAFAPWRWYQPDVVATLALGEQSVSQIDDLSTKLKPVTNYQYVLVFDYLRDLTDPTDQLLKTVEGFGFVGRGVLDYPGIGFVRIYTLPETTLGYSL